MPKKVEAAPKAIKTIENPTVNKTTINSNVDIYFVISYLKISFVLIFLAILWVNDNIKNIIDTNFCLSDTLVVLDNTYNELLSKLMNNITGNIKLIFLYL